jgi:hypothetical protein
VVVAHRLRLTYADGTQGDVDLSGRTWCGVFEPLDDPVAFPRVEVAPEAGNGQLAGRPAHGTEPLSTSLYIGARQHPVESAELTG